MSMKPKDLVLVEVEGHTVEGSLAYFRTQHVFISLDILMATFESISCGTTSTPSLASSFYKKKRKKNGKEMSIISVTATKQNKLNKQSLLNSEPQISQWEETSPKAGRETKEEA